MKSILKITPLLLVLLATFLHAQVRINEFQASNTSAFAEILDFEDYADWLELQNTSNTSIDLSQFYLTDNLNDPFKWRIPAGTTIPANGFLLIWADDHNTGIGERFQREYWPWDDFETVSLHANFKLSAAGEELALFRLDNENTSTLISQGSLWHYLDDGSDLGTAWQSPAFNDGGWPSGFAQLGYGDGDEQTELSYGGQTTNKYTTTYFRHMFNVTDPEVFDTVTLGIQYDDGAVIYLNGEEIARRNMPENQTIFFDTRASSARAGADEDIFETIDVDNSHFLSGNNLLAVEIHQATASSSDISFDLWLEASSSDITLIDSLKYPLQLTDVSRGRDPQSGAWRYFGEPTPGSANSTPGVTTTQTAPAVQFSHQPGFYSGGTQVTLQSSSPQAEIFYTTNGTNPSRTSRRYTGPLNLNATTPVRARAFEAGKLPGPIETRTFLTQEASTSLPVVSFVVDSLGFWDAAKGIYLNEFKQREIPVHLEFWESAQPNTLPDFSAGAGTRIGGLNIWRFAQKPLTIYLRNRYGNDVLDYQLFKSKTKGAFKRFVFRNGGDNWSKAMLRDPMTESIVHGQMLPTTQSYRPTVLYLNGQYWGIHNIRERFDEQYFASTFQVPESGYDHLEYASDAVGLKLFTLNGSATDYNALLDYLDNNDIQQNSVYAYVAERVDIDNFIDYLALELYVVNTSWRHNREWWRPNTPGGKWQWLVPDLDRGYNMSNVDRNLMPEFFSRYTLLGHLIENDSFQKRFVQRYMAHVNSTFAPPRMHAILDSLAAIIEPEIPRHASKWGSEGGISSLQNWRNELQPIKNFIDQRPAVVQSNLQNQFALSSPVNLTLTAHPEMGKILVEGIPQPGGLGTYFRNIPISLKAVPKPAYVFTGWSNGESNPKISVELTGNLSLTANFTAGSASQLTATISGNQRLTLANSPYVASGDVHITAGATLTIDAGVQVLMPENASFYVNGKLEINGSANERVAFLPNTDAGAETWGALVFSNAAETSHLNYLTIRKATLGGEPVQQKAAISAYNSSLVIDHLDIAEVPFPIFVRFGSTELRNSTLSGTATCDYINVKQGDAIVEGNTFLGNNSPDTDAIDYDGVIDGIIRNNRIYNFRGPNSDAIDIGEEAQGMLISGNIIYNMSDKGISIGQWSEIFVEHNLIVGCNLGIAVKDSSKAWITNNTLYGNTIGVALFEKNPGQWGGIAEVKNTLIASSTMQPVSADAYSDLTVSYSFSNTDLLVGANNLFGDPKFMAPLVYNFQLMPDSPCAGAGDPATQNNNGSRANIGANYVYSDKDFPASMLVAPQIVVNEIMYSPHPDKNSRDWIELYNPGKQTVDLSGWKLIDNDSTHVFVLPHATNLAPDTYLVVCRDSTAFRQVYGGSARLIGDMPYGLGSEDAVLLLDNRDTKVFQIGYKNAAPWPASADGEGYSLELGQPDSPNHMLENWHASTLRSGTPGWRNSTFSSGITNGENGTSEPDIMLANYPNPFSRSTTIQFALKKAGTVRLDIYDITGRHVKACLDENMQEGVQRFEWFGENNSGEHVSSGVYFYVLRTNTKTLSRKLLLLR